DRELASLALDMELDGKAGFPELVDQDRDVGQPGLGRERFVRIAAEHAEEATHLGQRAAACPLDGLEHLTRRGVCAVEYASLGSRLEDDHRDVMCDHVVQLASDPCTLLDDGLPCGQVPLSLGDLRPSLSV